MNEIKQNRDYSELDSEKSQYSTKIQLSFTLGFFLTTFMGIFFDSRMFIFYETEVGLPVIYILIALIVYGIWNMVNDPFIGFLSDKPNRLWKRWGRRFPWVIMAIIPYCLVFLLLFSPPDLDPVRNWLILFLWLLLMTCLLDLFLSIWNTNYYALYTDKFRSQKERTKVGGIGTIFGQLGIAIGVLIPPLFITYGVKQTYLIAVSIVISISIICIILMIPGIRENQDMIDRALQMAKKKEEEKESFWKILKFAMKQKNFLVYTVAYTAFLTLVVIMLASIPYLNQYILKQPASSETLITAGLLIGSLISIPLWVKLARKKGNKITFVTGMLFTAVSIIPFLFISDLFLAVITSTLIGVGIGGIYLATYPLLSDVLDEIIVKTKKRQEGSFLGIRTFFNRLSYITQAMTFTIVHIITGFNPTPGAPQTDLALWGIKIHLAIIPMIVIFLGGLILWKYCDIDAEKSASIKAQLKELNL